MTNEKVAFRYSSSNQVDQVRAIAWEPKEKCGVLQLCHGMCEYMDRYQEFAEFMCKQGFVVCGSNHIGHKESVKNDDGLGYFAKKDGWTYLIEDQHQLFQIMHAQYPNLPYFLFGHSMGSFVTRNYITSYGEGLTGYICCGTSGPNPAVNVGLAMAKLLKKMHGDHYRSSMLSKLAFSAYNKKFPKEEGPAAWISRDRDIVENYVKDPYCQFLFTTSGFIDLFTLLKRANTKKWYENVPKDLPILLTSGEMDPVGGYSKGVVSVYQQLKSSGVKDVTLKLYSEDRHEILNELDREKVYGDIWRWIEERI